MKKRRSALQQLSFIVRMHNGIRNTFSVPMTPEGHFVNENTIVRIAVALEKNGFKPVPPKPPPAGVRVASSMDWDEICARTVFLFRNIIVHTRGKYNYGKLQPPSRKLVPAWRAFYRTHPAAKVKRGQTLCLDPTQVITPLLQGCVDYVRNCTPTG